MKLRHLLIAVSLLVLPLCSCQQSGEVELRRERLQLGTLIEISAFGPEAQVVAALEAAFVEIDRIEALLSPHLPGSDVSRFNRVAAGEGVELSVEAATVVAAGLQLMRQTEGAFDLTLGRLIRLWDIEGDRPRVPSSAEIAAALEGHGLQGLELSGRRLQKKVDGLAIDLGGIGKGYAIDRAAAILRQHGIRRAAINAGGDLYLLGSRPERPWRIAIQHPRQPGGILATIDVTDQAMVTSGDYERYFERQGIRYHHLFDPHSGRPARKSQSVTVLAGNAMLADGLATALFVLGPEKGLDLLLRAGAEGLIIDAAGSRHLSPGLRGRVQWH